MRQRRGCRAAWAAVCAVALFAAAEMAQAGQGFLARLPLPPKTAVNDLAITFDCTWAQCHGYLPVRLTVTCTPPTPVDRTLSILITNQSRSEYRPVSVTTEVEIPAGTGTAGVTKIIPFPRHGQSYQVSFHVWEDGSHLDDLSFEDMGLYTGSFGQQAAPAVLFVGAAPVDVTCLDFMADPNVYQRTTATVSPTGNIVYTPPPTGQAPTLSIAQVSSFFSLPRSELFDEWIDYSSLDVIFISLADLENLARTRRRAMSALRQWTRAGGNLCVFGAGDAWEGLRLIERRLGCPASEKDARSPERGWKAPRPEDYNAAWEYSGSNVIAVEDPDEAAQRALLGQRAPGKFPFLSKDVGLGLVVAIAKPDPFPGDRETWRWLFATMGPMRWNWETRNGVTINAGTGDFDDFLIADVGLPPVKSYRVLITLFVIAIGPVNYWLLRRRGRLHWLLFTVPAAALVISLALVAYAVVGDGFQTYLRARSFTRLDQTRGEAVSWARLSLYSGTAPSGGLTLDRDTAILPMDRDATWSRRTPTRHVLWTQRQELPRGWLASRTPTQFTTVKPYACKRQLRVIESSDADRCAVENLLDTKISHVMLRSAAGKVFFHRDLGPGEKVELRALASETDSQQAILQMLTERNRNAPSHPQVRPTPASSIFFSGPRSAYQSNEYTGPGSSMLEECLAQAFNEVSSQLSQPRTYVAIVGRPPEVTIGVEPLAESQSLHVILGNW